MLEAARASNFSVEQEVWPVEEAKKNKCHLYVSHVAMEHIYGRDNCPMHFNTYYSNHTLYWVGTEERGEG